MDLINITIVGKNLSELPGWGLALVAALLILWLWSVVVIATEKTEDPYDRIVWILIVLLLNFVGTLLYIFFGPERRIKENGILSSDEELKRRVNEDSL